MLELGREENMAARRSPRRLWKEVRNVMSALNAFRHTGKVELDAGQGRPYSANANRKSYLIVVASVSTLIAVALCVAVAVPLSSRQKGPEIFSDIHLSTPIHLTCRSTQYPEACVTSLTSNPQAFGAFDTSQTGFAGIAVSSALSGVNNFYNYAANLQGNTQEMGLDQSAMGSCLAVLQDSQDQLTTSLNQLLNLSGANFNGQMKDVLTWMSAALTYHTTCMDGYDDVPGSVSDNMKVQGNDVEALLANAVSLVSGVVSSFSTGTADPSSLHNRRLLSSPTEDAPVYDMDGEFPEWLRVGDRRILQTSTNFTVVDATVAQDGSGQFETVQEAVDAAPQQNSNRYVIHIKQGIYNETVVIPRKATNLMLMGDGMGLTIITGSRSVISSNVTTYETATLAVTGRGFLAKDLSIQNTAGAINHQAVALRVEADHSAFWRVSIEGYQDTLYAHAQRQFYKNCTIYGTVDFIFGNAAAVFQTCTLTARAPLLGQQNTFTAQGRKYSSQNTGFSFQGCVLDASPDLQEQTGVQSYLGRPWKLYSRTVYLESFMTNVVDPSGWLAWNGTFALDTLFYGEYQNSGPGASNGQRVAWSTQITDANVAAQYTVLNFISGSEWLPQTNLEFSPTL